MMDRIKIIIPGFMQTYKKCGMNFFDERTDFIRLYRRSVELIFMNFRLTYIIGSFMRFTCVTVLDNSLLLRN